MAIDSRVVLVVDDDQSIRDLIQMLLGVELGVKTMPAADGQEALRQVRRVKPALVLLDIMLPKINGVEVARRLKADPATSDLPIVAMSAVREVLQEAVAAGAVDYVEKPFDLESLLAKVAAHLPARDGSGEEEGATERAPGAEAPRHLRALPKSGAA